MNAIYSSLLKLIEGCDLESAEAEAAMDEVMLGAAPHPTLAAWLVAMKMKGETPHELAGCAKSMRRHAIRIECGDPMLVDTCGTGGDGLHTINISTASAFVAAGAGVSVAKHGNRAVSSKAGSADVLESLGVSVCLPPQKAADNLNRIGISFLFAQSFHPAMKHAMPVRRELGFRTIFNLLGPLSNPAGARRGVLGVFSKPLCRTVAEAALELGFERLLVVHGSNGLDEITNTGATNVCEVAGGSISEYMLSPEDLGLGLCLTEDLLGGSPSENASMIKNILSGRDKGSKRDVIALNAAAAILVASKAQSWQDALALAFKSIDSGAAMRKLDALAASS